MPTKHLVKLFSSPAYYHIYNRASGERKLFRDHADRNFFLSLLQKHLAETVLLKNEGDTKQYQVEIVAYCLMGTHFHLLLYQEDNIDAITGYMRSVGTVYSMYYNKRYKSKGHVFQSSYRASHITNEPYLAHITRYIHLNPRSYTTWKWSSYKQYIGNRDDNWVHPERVIGDGSTYQYKQFVLDYSNTDRRKQYGDLSNSLAQ